MKKLLLVLILIIGISTTPIWAQEDPPTSTATQEETVSTEDDKTSLSEELEITQSSSKISFLSILFATITPALFIAVSYLLIKMNNK